MAKDFSLLIHGLRREIDAQALISHLPNLTIEQLLEVLRELNEGASNSYYLMGHIILVILNLAKERGESIRDVISMIMAETKMSYSMIYLLARLATEYTVEEWLSYPAIPYTIKALALTIKDKRKRLLFLDKVNEENLSYRKAKEYLRELVGAKKEIIVSASYIGFWDKEAGVLHTEDGPIDILSVLNNEFSDKKIKIEISLILD